MEITTGRLIRAMRKAGHFYHGGDEGVCDVRYTDKEMRDNPIFRYINQVLKRHRGKLLRILCNEQQGDNTLSIHIQDGKHFCIVTFDMEYYFTEGMIP